ncbi:sigma-70 family RNA polymerase sigma factor [Saccharibacillus sp. CPCC 101409]|uniref:RNA polymerase sigma factor n=1 Tax=Saccharibacillus sp. CPCC 101409 TaxID=3058041 RepID=UPI0026736ACC|nr:sigma-70 family RNA polymerase sigma factor [Saccharibacillus sp. CPCC 101409]MDO3411515.1 sigma-70 family RNA polymerase sigma factor [Saccharibacillus sp. CPCC 101409]
MTEWHNLLSNFDELSDESQEIVYRAYYKFIYRDVFYLLKDHGSTEDVIQETFFKVLIAIKKHRVKNIPAWIKQIARNFVMDDLRKRQPAYYADDLNYIKNIEEFSEQDKGLLPLADKVEIKMRNEVLHQALAELHSEYRQIILLFYIEGLSYREISTVLELSEQAVSQKLYRARKKLKKKFNRKWVNPK